MTTSSPHTLFAAAIILCMTTMAPSCGTQEEVGDGVVLPEDSVLVNLRLPNQSGQEARVVFGDHSDLVPIDASGYGRIALPRVEDSRLEVRVRDYAEQDGRWTTICSFPSDSVSSGVVDISYSSPGSGGILKQWPIVILWMSEAVDDVGPTSPLDFSLNGNVRGTAGPVGANNLKMAVRPDDEHRLSWLGLDGSEVCSTSIRLPANVRRTYVCEPADGEIEVR